VRRGSGWDEAKEVGEEMGMVSAAGGFWCGRWWSIIASDRGHRRCEGGGVYSCYHTVLQNTNRLECLLKQMQMVI
jgi:hypothetical protein